MSEIIFLDGEFTDRGEMLELSMFDLAGNEVYHSYFKPARARRWRLEPHNITPAMVADKPSFADQREKIQRLLDRVGVVAGFAVDNDVRHLEAEGIRFSRTWTIIECQELYWRHRSRLDPEFNTDRQTSLTATAEELGVTVDLEHEHSASGDTLVTLRLFNALLERLREADPSLPADPVESAKAVHREFELAAKELLRVKAHGFVRLIRSQTGHFFIRTSTEGGSALAPRKANVIAEIEVEDRFTAEFELLEKVVKKLEKKVDMRRAVTDADIAPFRKYTNTYDEVRSRYHRQMLRLRPSTTL